MKTPRFSLFSLILMISLAALLIGYILARNEIRQKSLAYAELIDQSKFIAVNSADEIRAMQLTSAPNVFAIQLAMPKNAKSKFVVEIGIQGGKKPLVVAKMDLSGPVAEPTVMDQKTVTVCLHKTFEMYTVTCESSDGGRVNKLVSDPNLVDYLDGLTSIDLFNATQKMYANKVLSIPVNSDQILCQGEQSASIPTQRLHYFRIELKSGSSQKKSE